MITNIVTDKWIEIETDLGENYETFVVNNGDQHTGRIWRIRKTTQGTGP